MATSRLLSFIEVVEGEPRADEVDLGGNTQIYKKENKNIPNTKCINNINMFWENKHGEMLFF